MPVLANSDIIWVIIVIVSVIAQLVKGAKKVASQAQVKSTGADGAGSSVKGGGQKPDFVAPDEALQEFLRSLGGGQKPAGGPSAPSPVQAISATRGISGAWPRKSVRANRPPIGPPIQETPLSKSSEVCTAGDLTIQEDVVLEKTSPGTRTTASILGEAIRKDLSDTEAIRKAIMLREILGPPVALRG